MTNSRPVLLILLLISGVCLFTAMPVNAETGIKLSSPQFDLVLKSSQPLTREFIIENIGEDPIEIHIALKKPDTIPESLSIAGRINLETPTTYLLYPDEKMLNSFSYDAEKLPSDWAYFALFEIKARSLEETLGFDELSQNLSLNVKISMRNTDNVTPHYVYQTDLNRLSVVSLPDTRDISLRWTNATPNSVNASTRLIIQNQLNSAEKYTVENPQAEFGALDGKVLGQELGLKGFWPKWYSVRSDFLTEKGENRTFTSNLVYISWQFATGFGIGLVFAIRLLTVFIARKRYLAMEVSGKA